MTSMQHHESGGGQPRPLVMNEEAAAGGDGTRPRVGAIVVHWRGMNETSECLESLARSTYADLDVLVVINGHEDFDRERAAAACPRYLPVVSETNLGYAGGCNLGARTAIERGAKFVVVVNNDTVVAPETFDVLIDAMDEQSRAGIVAPVITYYDAPARVWSAGGYLNRALGYTRHYLLDDSVPASGGLRNVDFVTGCFFMVRSAVWEELAGMDARYFHFFDDVDLCERARALGYDTCLVPRPLVRHKVSASTGTRGSNRLNAPQAYYFSRSRMLFIRRVVRGPARYCAAVSQVLVLLPYDVLRALIDRSAGAAAGRVAGVVDALRGRDGPSWRQWSRRS